ncbi:DUF4262 domain-containing protein [Streptomyces uncialis]|uniref:DUF4262 domain-containing protein n=1 Tax=Streptomyces uncialis TaxID=1048205 RepID=UPI00386B508A|nr:DUF4262 domain-containing protein [Streptomyces uncialis]
MHDDPAECRCVICHDYGDRHEADALDLRTLEHVLGHGWSVVMVPPDEEGPGFAYTIGLWHSFRTPEVAMFGLDIHVMRTCLNTLGQRAAQGRTLSDGQRCTDVIAHHSLALKAVDPRWHRTFFGSAISFYRRPPFPVLEAVWPDREGHYLWQDESGHSYRGSQPWLWLEPAEHPVGVWTTPL